MLIGSILQCRVWSHQNLLVGDRSGDEGARGVGGLGGSVF